MPGGENPFQKVFNTPHTNKEEKTMADLKMLAIDLGASSGRGIIGRFDGERLTLEENHRFPSDPVTVAGTFSWDILRIFFEIKQAINK